MDYDREFSRLHYKECTKLNLLYDGVFLIRLTPTNMTKFCRIFGLQTGPYQ